MDRATAQVATGRLMESGQLLLQADMVPLLVRRGMRLLTNDGSFVGFIAAVVMALDTTQVTHLLLTRHCPHPQYQMVPVGLIAEVTGLQIQLRVGQPVIDALPPWQNGGQ